MQTFYGTKRITAKPMNRRDYNTLRGWALPANENGDDEGYLVEYQDGGEPNHPNFTGYISWSPKAQFERAYQPLNGLSFGHALVAMEQGRKVARSGWNGKGMWLALSCDGTRKVPAGHFWSDHNGKYAYEQPDGCATVLPCITMKTATGEILMGWLASQTDMLAHDWTVVE